MSPPTVSCLISSWTGKRESGAYSLNQQQLGVVHGKHTKYAYARTSRTSNKDVCSPSEMHRRQTLNISQKKKKNEKQKKNTGVWSEDHKNKCQITLQSHVSSSSCFLRCSVTTELPTRSAALLEESREHTLVTQLPINSHLLASSLRAHPDQPLHNISPFCKQSRGLCGLGWCETGRADG